MLFRALQKKVDGRIAGALLSLAWIVLVWRQVARKVDHRCGSRDSGIQDSGLSNPGEGSTSLPFPVDKKECKQWLLPVIANDVLYEGG